MALVEKSILGVLSDLGEARSAEDRMWSRWFGCGLPSGFYGFGGGEGQRVGFLYWE